MATLGKILLYVSLYMFLPAILALAVFAGIIGIALFISLVLVSRETRRRQAERLMEERRARWREMDLERELRGLAGNGAGRPEKTSPFDGAPPEPVMAGLWRRSTPSTNPGWTGGYALLDDDDLDEDFLDWDFDAEEEENARVDLDCPFCGGTGYAVDDIDLFDGDPEASAALCDSCGGSGRV